MRAHTKVLKALRTDTPRSVSVEVFGAEVFSTGVSKRRWRHRNSMTCRTTQKRSRSTVP